MVLRVEMEKVGIENLIGRARILKRGLCHRIVELKKLEIDNVPDRRGDLIRGKY